jgi:orotidine-5'-phosphate decarboxylase
MSNRSVALHDPSPTPNGPIAVEDRLIVALDVSSAAEAEKLVSAIGESAHIYKVGKQLFTAEGPQVVRDLVASGRKVFLDLKFHDSPQKVLRAAVEATRLGVKMFDIHPYGSNCGSTDMMTRTRAEVARICRTEGLRRPSILAVATLADTKSPNSISRLPGLPDRVSEIAPSPPTRRSTASSPGRMKSHACATLADADSSS